MENKMRQSQKIKWFDRLKSASEKWGATTQFDIAMRFRRHAKNCKKGCNITRNSIDNGEMFNFEFACWTANVLYEASQICHKEF